MIESEISHSSQGLRQLSGCRRPFYFVKCFIVLGIVVMFHFESFIVAMGVEGEVMGCGGDSDVFCCY